MAHFFSNLLLLHSLNIIKQHAGIYDISHTNHYQNRIVAQRLPCMALVGRQHDLIIAQLT
jgi:hypothetical protein